MATGWPMKTTYANGDVYSAGDVNDITGTINLLGSSVAYAAGKNKIINGDFRVWQRGTSFTNNANTAYNADRFKQFYDGAGATRIISQQTFTPGTAPAAPYESQYFLRFNQSVAGTLGTFNTLTQPIEDVRTLAGNTVTLSYWAKAAATLSLTIEADQGFGSGGSSTVTTSVVSGQTITTSWVRYSHTFTMPSVSGKTIGTSSFVNLSFKLPLNTTFTFDTWGWQLEQGSTATAFQTATGTLQGELAACQRYYWRSLTGYTFAPVRTTVISNASTTGYGYFVPNCTMRIPPTSVDFSNLTIVRDGAGTWAVSALTINNATVDGTIINLTAASGMAAGTSGQLVTTNSTGYLGFSAEL